MRFTTPLPHNGGLNETTALLDEGVNTLFPNSAVPGQPTQPAVQGFLQRVKQAASVRAERNAANDTDDTDDADDANSAELPTSAEHGVQGGWKWDVRIVTGVWVAGTQLDNSTEWDELHDTQSDGFLWDDELDVVMRMRTER